MFIKSTQQACCGHASGVSWQNTHPFAHLISNSNLWECRGRAGYVTGGINRQWHFNGGNGSTSHLLSGGNDIPFEAPMQAWRVISGKEQTTTKGKRVNVVLSTVWELLPIFRLPVSTWNDGYWVSWSKPREGKEGGNRNCTLLENEHTARTSTALVGYWINSTPSWVRGQWPNQWRATFHFSGTKPKKQKNRNSW